MGKNIFIYSLKIFLIINFFVLILLSVSGGYLWVQAPQYEIPKTVEFDLGLPRQKVGDFWLHLEAFGSPTSPVVIVLHGGPGGDYRALLPLQALSDQYRVVFYDQRGSGLSQRVPDPAVTVDGLVSELNSIVDHFSPRQPVRLVGHSWGAMLATAYIQRHADRVSHLVLGEPGMLTSEAAREFDQRTNHMQPRSSSLSLLVAVLRSLAVGIKASVPDSDGREDAIAASIMTLVHPESPIAGYFCGHTPATAFLPSWRFGARMVQALMSSARQKDGSLEIPWGVGIREKFNRKVLFMVGQCNVIIGEDFQRKYHVGLFKDYELVVIPRAGHTFLGEKTEQSLEILRAYFKESH